MRLCDILSRMHLQATGAVPATLEITHLCAHSSECTQSSIFVCLEGHRDSGVNHIKEAISRGTRVIITDQKLPIDADVYQIISRNARKSGAEIARLLYQEVFFSLRFLFITGTKGKTTTAKMLSHLLCRAGYPAATVGTLGIEFGTYRASTNNTTPDLFALLEHLKRIQKMGAKFVILEVSSQALRDYRIDGLRGDAAIFTGLSVDHIDPREHPCFLDYMLSKRRLFFDFGVRMAFAPKRCPLSELMLCGVEKSFYADTKGCSDLTLKIKEMSKSGILFTDGLNDGFLSMSGEYNLRNAALAVLCASKITGENAAFFYPLLSEVKLLGRLEGYLVQGREVVIDYAHNAQSIREIGALFRKLSQGRLVAVIGSVAGRARGRRRDLAIACERTFDFTILTEDDSICESAKSVVDELYSYFFDRTRCDRVLPRERAILEAFSHAAEGDTILLLGKGHENTIVRQGKREPFDERAILTEIEAGKYGKI